MRRDTQHKKTFEELHCDLVDIMVFYPITVKVGCNV